MACSNLINVVKGQSYQKGSKDHDYLQPNNPTTQQPNNPTTQQPNNPLSRNNTYFARLKEKSFSHLTQAFDWIEERYKSGFWFYTQFLASNPTFAIEITYLNSEPLTGINLPLQDYLSLPNHPAIHTNQQLKNDVQLFNQE